MLFNAFTWRLVLWGQNSLRHVSPIREPSDFLKVFDGLSFLDERT